MDLDLFTILSKDDKPKKASEMAQAAGADSKLVCMSELCFDIEVETDPHTSSYPEAPLRRGSDSRDRP